MVVAINLPYGLMVAFMPGKLFFNSFCSSTKNISGLLGSGLLL